MTIPIEPVEVPAAVRELAGAASVDAVWLNELGGRTFRIGDGRYVKWQPYNAETSVIDEVQRLEWVGAFSRVPRVLEVGADHTHEWLVTGAIPGESAVAPRWIADPAVAVRAVGEGLRALHDALPVDECPFDWSVRSRVRNAESRGIPIPYELHEGPTIDRLVVCHGDACCPNTLLDDDGRWTAHVDLGSLGVADRWADLAVASMSTEWNYGPGWADALLEAYGIQPDRERIAYYRDLWNAM